MRKPGAAPDLLIDEKLPAPPRQKRSRNKRDLLLRAGLELFAEKGYEATTVGEIASRAAVATGGFYQHFFTKKQLLLVLMQNLVDQLAQVDLRFGTGGSLEVSLEEFLQSAFAKDLAYAGALRAWAEAASADEGLARKQQQVWHWTTARVGSVFSGLLKLPGARQGVDVSSLALVMDRLFWHILAEAAHLPQKETTRLVRTASHLLYHALFRDATG